MKILVFVKTFANPTLTFIYNEITELAKNNDVKIITCERKNIHLFPFDDVVEIPFVKNKFIAKILNKLQFNDIEIGFKNVGFAKKLNKIVDDFAPDVIHTHFGFESWVFLMNFRATNIPIFISFHGYDASHKLNSSRYCQTLKKIFTRPNLHPIFVSHFMQKQVEQKLRETIPKAQILYYGTDTEFFKRQQYNFPRNPITFLQVSSFATKKGHEFTIRAFAKFLEQYQPEASQNTDVGKEPYLPPMLILAGDGPLRKPMMALVKALSVADSIKFPGLVNREQARALMERSHVFVHHSVTSKPVGDMEGIPNALMEAMAMELPILSTIHSGIPELVEDGKHGYLVAEEDIETYAQRMADVLTWPYLPRNREKILAQFEKTQHAEQLLAYYDNCI